MTSPRSQGEPTERGIRNSKLARTLAGVLPEAPPPVTSLDFAPRPPPAYAAPYGGPKNTPGLPPFMPPGSSLAIEDYLRRQNQAPAASPSAAPAPIPAPPPTPPVTVAATPPQQAEVPPMPPTIPIQPMGQQQLPASFDPTMTAATQYAREYAVNPGQFGPAEGTWLHRLFGVGRS